MTAAIPWSVPVRRDNVPEAGLHLDLVADEATRAAVAALAGVKALPRLQASFDVIRQGSGLKVVGEVSATVEQTCVVSLEPMSSEVREPIDLAFVEPSAEPLSDPDDMAEIAGLDDVVDPDAPDGPEPLVNGTVDLGAAASEFLLLGIDPYPRKPEAVFAAPKSAADEPVANPFAVLAKLKQDPPKR
ncbi:MAG TPA: DUF177 domain-containing protein [Xanthobacteraceae bacterium]|jgi:uncharacterized metal-binding protein YceD (DUF177 family)